VGRKVPLCGQHAAPPPATFRRWTVAAALSPLVQPGDRIPGISGSREERITAVVSVFSRSGTCRGNEDESFSCRL